MGTSGAAVLAARAGLRAGAGLLTIACPAAVRPEVAIGLPEAMSAELPGVSWEHWRGLLRGKRSLVLGPGLGTGTEAQNLARWLVARVDQPLVVDADGLNALVGRLGTLRAKGGLRVLTPHPGEMARLLDSSVREIQGARPQSARELAELTRSVVVLKGSGTVVAAPGGHLSVNATGGPLLGTAGTGDVLAGLLGGLLAQGLEPWDAA